MIRQRLNGFRERIELLPSIAAGARHILKRHLQPRALQVVGQVRHAVFVQLCPVDDDRAVFAHRIAFDDDSGFFLAHVLNDHRTEQVADLATRIPKVTHQPRQRLVGLLNLGLLLQARRRRALLALESCRHAADALDGGAVVLQHLEMLVGQGVVALDLESGAWLSHALRIELDARVHAADSRR